MNSTIKNVLARVRKYLLFIIIIPLLLGALGYFVQGNNAEPASATSTIKIELGSYKDAPKFTDSAMVQETITKIVYENFEDLTDEEITNIISKLNIEPISQGIVSLSFKGKDEEEAKEILGKISDEFLALDKKEFQIRKDNAEGKIEKLEAENVSDGVKGDTGSVVLEDTASKQRLIYEIEKELVLMEEAEVLRDLSVTPDSVEDLSPKKRAVLGVLIGITIMAGFIVIPEVFRRN